MPNSMTGFARRELATEYGTLIWEIRSVNHRFLEPILRLPDSLRELEPGLRERLRKQLSRGKIEAILHLQQPVSEDHQQPGRIRINQGLVSELVAALHDIEQALPTSAPINPMEVLRWPGVVETASADKETLLTLAADLFEQTVAGLQEHRQREGNELKNLIEQRLQAITQQVAQVREQMPTILQAQRQRLQDKVAALQVELDSDRLEQEMVLLAQKADVDEELDRLDTHVTEVHHSLKQSGSIGRRLDFLMQELNREANTLSSKSVVSDTTQAAVELKVLIEQMREQIQNIE